MSAALTDNFMQVAAEGAITFMTSGGKAVGATSFGINDSTGWPTTTGFIIAVRQVDSNGNEVAGTYTEWVATLSGTTITLGTTPSPVVGTDQVYAGGDLTQVYVPVSSTRDNRLVNTILQQHNQDGTHGAITAASETISGTLGVTGTTTLAGVVMSGTISGTGGVSANFTPVWGGLTIGNAVVQCNYMQIQKLVYLTLYMQIGSTSSFTGGPVEFSLPVNARRVVSSVIPIFISPGVIAFSGSTIFQGYCTGDVLGQNANISFIISNSNTSMGATNPFTWGTGDTLEANLVYEAA